MIAVLQRSRQASVSIANEVVGSIDFGLVILLGIEEADGPDDIEWLTRKIINLRIFNDSDGVMNVSCQDAGGDYLVISQFTLHASTKKGNRPSYIKSAGPDISKPLYQDFVQQLESISGKTVQTGEFGADMQVSLINDGPVTILIDTKDKK